MTVVLVQVGDCHEAVIVIACINDSKDSSNMAESQNRRADSGTPKYCGNCNKGSAIDPSSCLAACGSRFSGEGNFVLGSISNGESWKTTPVKSHTSANEQEKLDQHGPFQSNESDVLISTTENDSIKANPQQLFLEQESLQMDKIQAALESVDSKTLQSWMGEKKSQELSESSHGFEEVAVAHCYQDKQSKRISLEKLSGPLVEGFVLKKCRRNGDDKPWRRRWFMLYSASIVYHRSLSKTDNMRLFVDIVGASVRPCDAPVGYGISIHLQARFNRVFCFSTHTKSEREAWLSALSKNTQLYPVAIPDDPITLPTASGIYRFKSAVASAFATSNLGKHLIRRHLDEAGRSLITQILDFSEKEYNRQFRSKLETYVFDVASRIAVIVHENKLPPDLDITSLYDETISFCQLYVRYSRDRRLHKERLAAVSPTLHLPDYASAQDERVLISTVDVSELQRSMAYVTSEWRRILEPGVSKKTLERFDFIVSHLLHEDKLKAIFDDPVHRNRMAEIERCLRELMETC
eukprot:gene2158-5186_t